MAAELLDASPLFAAELRACDEALSALHRLVGRGGAAHVPGAPRLNENEVASRLSSP